MTDAESGRELPGVLAQDEPVAVSECSPILAIDKWLTNGHLIADCARLGYLRKEWLTLDPTFGYGTFWKVFRPDELVACDLDPAKSPIGYPVDFTALPWPDRHFKASVYDGPYKLNGNPSDTGGVDERFGVHEYTRWQDRLDLLVRGAVEVARVTDEYLLVKCQDQVVSGKLRWQTVLIIEALEAVGFGLKDRMEFLGRRAQPAGRGQNNAHRASSQMLVFKRGWSWRPAPEPSVVGEEHQGEFVWQNRAELVWECWDDCPHPTHDDDESAGHHLRASDDSGSDS